MSGNQCKLFNLIALFCLLFAGLTTSAQSPFSGFENLFTPPLNYVVHKTTSPIIIDGDISDAAWQKAAWTSRFVDIEGDLKPHPTYSTQVKMLWDDSCLYIAAQLTEPQVWATLQNHDQIIFNDNFQSGTRGPLGDPKRFKSYPVLQEDLLVKT